MNGEKNTSIVMLTIAVVCLILASVFAPQDGVEAKSDVQPRYAVEDVSRWLLRLASWAPSQAPVEHPSCPEAAQQAAFWEFL